MSNIIGSLKGIGKSPQSSREKAEPEIIIGGKVI